MKRIIAWFLCALIALSLALPAFAAGYTPGTYQGTAAGRDGDVTVEVVVSKDKIESVEVTHQQETASIATPALEKLPAQIIEYQSLNLDVITGCTITSQAVLNAVAEALTQAGADVEALKSAARPEVAKGQTIELSADVVVIGAGGAGLSAAVEAKDAGVGSVILLEKLSSIGGTTFTSQGIIGGYDTSIAKKLEVRVTYEEMYDNLMHNASYRLDPALTQVTVRKSGETIDWLQDRVKMPFEEKIVVGYGPLQMMHIITGAGAGMHEPFMNAINASGIELMLETRAESLMMNEDGSVGGVRAKRGQDEIIINAKSVVIATGGYANNAELAALLNPEMAGTYGIGFPGATGDGIIMASNAGAAITHASHLMALLKDYEIMEEHNGTSATANVSRFIAAPNLVMVGQNAKRFVDEKSGGFMTQELNAPVFDQMHRDGLGYVWAITDTASQEALEFKRGLDMPFVQAETVEELAKAMNLNPETLEETLTNYNKYVEAGHDPEFGRLSMTPLTAPYIAVKVVPCHIITYGGVARNINAEVIRADNTVIPGLYVAGEAGANSAYMGFTLSNCFTWGRIAGRNAAVFASEK